VSSAHILAQANAMRLNKGSGTLAYHCAPIAIVDRSMDSMAKSACGISTSSMRLMR